MEQGYIGSQCLKGTAALVTKKQMSAWARTINQNGTLYSIYLLPIRHVSAYMVVIRLHIFLIGLYGHHNPDILKYTEVMCHKSACVFYVRTPFSQIVWFL
jgi:hypothetical protein